MSIPVRLVLVDDHSVIRELIRSQLTRHEAHRYEIVGEGSTGPEAVDVCRRTRPDLLLLDLILPGFTGVEVVKTLKPELPQMKVLYFSAISRTPLIVEALALGANGFVGKPRSWQTVLEAVNAVAAGGQYFDRAVARLVKEAAQAAIPAEQAATGSESGETLPNGDPPTLPPA